MHNAASISGMAFGNAFLGIVHAMAHVTGSKFHLVHGRTNAIYLPHVIRYNGRVPTKLTSWPKYERYIAPERFQEIALHLGPAGIHPRRGRGVVRAGRREAARRGRHRAVVPGAGRVDETSFIGRLDELAMAAYEDQCAPANPRMPMVADMRTLMEAAYYGTSFDEVRAHRGVAASAADSVDVTADSATPKAAVKKLAPRAA